jgi:D-glutamate cyclase
VLKPADQTQEAINRIEEMCARDSGGRGIARLAEFASGNLYKAATSIARHRAPHVAIMTGFWILHGKPPSPENDGPPGAAHIAAALSAGGIPSRLVTDTLSAYAVRAAARGAGLPENYPLDVVSLTGRGGEYGRSIDDLKTEWLSAVPPVSHVISIERCGPRHDGKCYNARGFDITGVNAPLHELFAGGPWTTIGIGDGGNELGMGSLPRPIVESSIPKGRDIACVVACDHLLVCGVSNWGGYAIPAALALLLPHRRSAFAEKLNRRDDLAILKTTTFEGHAVQGATGTEILSVDKLAWEVHADLLDEIVGVVQSVPDGKTLQR